ncbi:MAG: hypothetical protein OEX07_02655 [Gammaproteobacteria bacterium]|nr:hypothetical protein [Gammaproteobacteria bacterium]
MVVTGVGSISNVGFNHKMSSANYYAGITRRGPLDFVFFDYENSEVAPVLGHAVSLNKGFQGNGRISRMAAHALLDLIQNYGDALYSSKNLHLILVTGDDYYQVQNVKNIDGLGQSVLNEIIESINFENAQYAKELESTIGSNLNDFVDKELVFDSTKVVRGGECKLAEVFKDINEVLVSNPDLTFLVLASDTLVQPIQLETMADLSLINHVEEKGGFFPGEASVCFLIESESSAIDCGKEIISSLNGIEYIKSDAHRFSDFYIQDNGLFQCADRTMENITGTQQEKLFVNLNGDSLRAKKLSNSFIKLINNKKVDPNIELLTPATTFGDCYSVNSAISISLVIHGFLRGIIKQNAVSIWLLSDNGDCASLNVVKY